jgi:hypothetical protein
MFRRVFAALAASWLLALYIGCTGRTPSNLEFPVLRVTVANPTVRMNPNSPSRLGVHSLFSKEFHAIQATDSLVCDWEVISAEGYRGFINPAEAIKDLGFANGRELDPIMTVATPANWPNGSVAILKINLYRNGVLNDSGRFVVDFNDGGGLGWHNARVVLYPDFNLMNPYRLQNLGVEGFYTVGMDVTHLTPGVSYEWRPIYAYGYRGFPSMEHALSDVGCVSRRALNPKVTLRTPENWPENSVVLWSVTITYEEIENSTARFTLMFVEGGCFGAGDGRAMVYPEGRFASPFKPFDLGVSSLYVVGADLTHRTPGVQYRWVADSSYGSIGFFNDGHALGDIEIADPTALNPTVSVRHPERWPSGSTAVLRLDVTCNGIQYNSALFALTFNMSNSCEEQWEYRFANASPVIVPESVAVNPDLGGGLGVQGYDLSGSGGVNSNTPGIRQYYSIVAAYGYAGFSSDSEAMGDVVLDQFDCLSPKVSFGHPEMWPDGSGVLLGLVFEYNGAFNTRGRFFVRASRADWADNAVWDGRRQVSLLQSESHIGSRAVSQVNVGGWAMPGSPIDFRNPNVGCEWVVLGVSNAAGFGSNQAAMDNVSFVDKNVLNPRIVLGSPDQWVTGSRIELGLTLNYRGVPNSTARHILYVHRGLVDDVVFGEYSRVVSCPSLVRAMPQASQRLDFGHFRVVGHDIYDGNPGTIFSWAIVDAFGHGAYPSKEAALNDLYLEGADSMRPVLKCGNPARWPDQSGLILKLNVSQGAAFCESTTAVVLFDNGSVRFSNEAQVNFQPGAVAVHPDRLHELGISRFDVVGSRLTSANEGVRYNWRAVGAYGYTSFSNLSSALADVVVSRADSLSPAIELRNPKCWPQHSSVLLECEVGFGGAANSTGRVLVVLDNGVGRVCYGAAGWHANAPVTFNPIQARAEASFPVGLGIKSMSVSGTNIDHHTQGLSFQWVPLFAKSDGFDTMAEALADVVIEDPGAFNPVVRVKNPGMWIPYSYVVLKAKVSYGGITNETGRMVLSFTPECRYGDSGASDPGCDCGCDGDCDNHNGGEDDPWCPCRPGPAPRALLVAQFYPNVAWMEAYNLKNFGIGGFSIGGSYQDLKNIGSMSFSWRPVSASGYTGYSSVDQAVAGVRLVNPNVFDPSPFLYAPANWPAGSSVLFEGTVRSGGLSYVGFFTVIFVEPDDGSGFSNAGLDIVPNEFFRMMNPHYPKTLGVYGWALRGDDRINQDSPNVKYQWRVAAAYGGGSVSEIGFNSASLMNPTLVIAKPLDWPVDSMVVLRCQITHDGKVNDTMLVTVVFDWTAMYSEEGEAIGEEKLYVKDHCWNANRQVTFTGGYIGLDQGNWEWQYQTDNKEPLKWKPSNMTSFITTMPPTSLGIDGMLVSECADVTNLTPGVEYYWEIESAHKGYEFHESGLGSDSDFENLKNSIYRMHADEFREYLGSLTSEQRQAVMDSYMSSIPGRNSVSFSDFIFTGRDTLNPMINVRNWKKYLYGVTIILKCNVTYRGVTNSTGRFTVVLQGPYINIVDENNNPLHSFSLSADIRDDAKVGNFIGVGINYSPRGHGVSQSTPSGHGTEGYDGFGHKTWVHWQAVAAYDVFPDDWRPVPGTDFGFFGKTTNGGTSREIWPAIANVISPRYLLGGSSNDVIYHWPAGSQIACYLRTTHFRGEGQGEEIDLFTPFVAKIAGRFHVPFPLRVITFITPEVVYLTNGSGAVKRLNFYESQSEYGADDYFGSSHSSGGGYSSSNATVRWVVTGASGYKVPTERDPGGFSSLADALSDVILPYPNAVFPTIKVGNPDYWLPYGIVMLQMQLTTREGTNTTGVLQINIREEPSKTEDKN